jgi:hypothetical protein
MESIKYNKIKIFSLIFFLYDALRGVTYISNGRYI